MPKKRLVAPDKRCRYHPDNAELECVAGCCEKCGWNPEVRCKRVEKVLEELKNARNETLCTEVGAQKESDA